MKENKIKKLKEKLNKTTEVHDLNSSMVLEASQKLDKYIVKEMITNKPKYSSTLNKIDKEIKCLITDILTEEIRIAFENIKNDLIK